MAPEDAEARNALIRELSTLTTEHISPDRVDLDTLTTDELARAMNAEDARVPDAVAACIPEISRAVDGIVDRMSRGGRLIYLGAGTAGRIGVLDASECPPTFGTDPSLIIGLIAGGDEAIRSAVENAEDNEHAAASQLQDLNLTPEDTVVGISASGRTPYVLGGLRYANEVGALTLAIASNTPSAIGAIADIPIEVVVGPEFLAGSTRLKSGTAQKLVVNMLTTLSMVRFGKTYRGVMVDLQATNKKLHARSVRTVMMLTDADADLAEHTLSAVNGSVKEALLVLIAGIPPEQAGKHLERAQGKLSTALASHIS